MAQHLEVLGLRELTAALKGPAFKDVNAELRRFSRLIAVDLMPGVQAAVRQSPAPQAAAMAATVRVHSDRVPVIVVGKTNPRFSKRWNTGPADRKKRRGSMARGVVAGGLGGQRATAIDENYYRIPRDPSWGALGAALRTGGLLTEAASDLYIRHYLSALRAHGFDVHGGAR